MKACSTLIGPVSRTGKSNSVQNIINMAQKQRNKQILKNRYVPIREHLLEVHEKQNIFQPWATGRSKPYAAQHMQTDATTVSLPHSSLCELSLF